MTIHRGWLEPQLLPTQVAYIHTTTLRWLLAWGIVRWLVTVPECGLPVGCLLQCDRSERQFAPVWTPGVQGSTGVPRSGTCLLLLPEASDQASTCFKGSGRQTQGLM